MIVLGFDTATPASAIGLRLSDASTVQARDDPAPGERPGHATRLLPLAAKLLSQAGLAWGDLERIAVGIGPGTFTGLRIGVASARGLAQSLGIELVGVSSLRALAQVAVGRVDGDQGVLTAIDARRGEIFAAAYIPADGAAIDCERSSPRELVAPRALAPDDLCHILEQAMTGESVTRWIAVGNGATLYREKFEGLGVQLPPDDSQLHMLSGGAICEIAASSVTGTIDVVLPNYCRRPDAEISLERARMPQGVKG